MRQIKLDGAKNSAAISLDSFFYPRHLLQQAAMRFSKIAKVYVSDAKGRLVVSIKPKGKAKAEETALHFCNFALSLKRELGEHA